MIAMRHEIQRAIRDALKNSYPEGTLKLHDSADLLDGLAQRFAILIEGEVEALELFALRMGRNGQK